ncbi:hypothetical protein [Streptomyces sp. NPDC015131]|uniref:hypothetical protein n=1 Tax=Streptomyces sp. NPDC015131 TaxID=3364941 RepID=UPI0036F5977B
MRNTVRNRKTLAVTCVTAAVVTLGGLTAAAPAAAETSGAGTATVSGRGVTATFEGGRLDLARGWGDARACGVWRDAVTCFRTVAELDRNAAAVGRARAESGALAACSSPLQLAEHNNLRPRILRFYDRGYWQNLDRYSFNDKTSSYRTGACTAHLAEHNDGRGYWYPGNTGPNHTENAMRSGWNDRVSSIKID